MSLYIGDQQIKNVTFTVNGTNTVSQSQLMLDVTTIGIVANNKNVSANNSLHLKTFSPVNCARLYPALLGFMLNLVTAISCDQTTPNGFL